jgi:hypothetical protein
MDVAVNQPGEYPGAGEIDDVVDLTGVDLLSDLHDHAVPNEDFLSLRHRARRGIDHVTGPEENCLAARRHGRQQDRTHSHQPDE